MLTRNFIKVLFILSGNVTATDVTNTQKIMYGIYPHSSSNAPGQTLDYEYDESCRLFTKEVDSDLQVATSDVTGSLGNAFYINSTSGYTSNTLCILVGTGATPATLDDYKLESQLELTSGIDSCRMDSNTGIITLTREFINNTGDSVTIKELGVYNVSIQRTGAIDINVFLVGREVLAEPVIIDNGKSYTFSYFIDMSGILPQS